MPKYGAGLHTGSLCHWDGENDRVLTVPWENAHALVIVTVFGVGFFGSKVPVIDNIIGRFRRQGKRLIPLSRSKHMPEWAFSIRDFMKVKRKDSRTFEQINKLLLF